MTNDIPRNCEFLRASDVLRDAIGLIQATSENAKKCELAMFCKIAVISAFSVVLTEK
jgi:hypothetical protein